MVRYVSLLRGINVGGQKKISMAQLKELYEDLGFSGVMTYVQSGNVVFSDTSANVPNIKSRIEREIKRSFGMDVLIFIRTQAELKKLTDNSPFKQKDGTKLHVTFLSEEPGKIPKADLDRARHGGEDYSIAGKEIYLFCPNGYGSTKLSNNFFERKLGVSATTRNWRTVNTLLSMSANDIIGIQQGD